MARFYHVDVANKLRQGYSFFLNPSGLSRFGLLYGAKLEKAGIRFDEIKKGEAEKSALSLDTSAYREFHLELVRRTHPVLTSIPTVSRFSAFFVVSSVADAHRLIQRRRLHASAEIFAVDADGPSSTHDMTWLDQEFPQDPAAFGYYYANYWLGRRISEDAHLATHESRGSLMETLLCGQITVCERL